MKMAGALLSLFGTEWLRAILLQGGGGQKPGWAQYLVQDLEIKFKGHRESEQGNLSDTCG